jgi:hypothetical protein
LKAAATGFGRCGVGDGLSVVVTAIILIVLGVVFGFVFPVIFVAAAAGFVLLLFALFATGRRAKNAVDQSTEAS